MAQPTLFSRRVDYLSRAVLPFGVYIFLNGIFFHIALIITEQRPVAFLRLTTVACGDPVGFQPKLSALYGLFLLSRLLFIFLASRVLVRKYPHIDIRSWVGSYVMMDFLLVVLSFLFPMVYWEVYFSTAHPILDLKKMWGPPVWPYFLGTGTVCLFCYQASFRGQPLDYLKIFAFNAIAFGLAFCLFYLYFRRVVLLF